MVAIEFRRNLYKNLQQLFRFSIQLLLFRYNLLQLFQKEGNENKLKYKRKKIYFGSAQKTLEPYICQKSTSAMYHRFLQH